MILPADAVRLVVAVLQGSDDPGGPDRAEARRILAGRKYHPAEVPKPFAGALHRLGGWLRPVAEPVGRFLSHLPDHPIPAALLALAVLAVAAVASTRLARRRIASPDLARSSGGRGIEVEDPDALDRRAREAEAEGRLELAYRLRFRAGLLRLSAAGALPYRPSLTTRGLVDLVRSTPFDHLAQEFDEVVYGRRPLSSADLQEARDGWQRVLEEVGAT
jgi:hypothetical protein